MEDINFDITRRPVLRVYERKKRANTTTPTPTPVSVFQARDRNSNSAPLPLPLDTHSLLIETETADQSCTSISKSNKFSSRNDKPTASTVGKEKCCRCINCGSTFTGGVQGHKLSSLIGKSKIQYQESTESTEFGVSILEALDVVFEITKKAEQLEILGDVVRESICSKCAFHLAQLYTVYIEFVELTGVSAVMKQLLEFNTALEKYHYSRISSNLVGVENQGVHENLGYIIPGDQTSHAPADKDFVEKSYDVDVFDTEIDTDWPTTETCSETEVFIDTIAEGEVRIHPKENNTSNQTPSSSKCTTAALNREHGSKLSFQSSKPRRLPQLKEAPNCSYKWKKYPGLTKFFEYKHFKLKCNVCGYYFSSTKQILAHFEQCHPSQNQEIELLKLRCEKNYRIHMRRRPDPKRFKCTECGLILNTLIKLKSHMKKSHTVVPVKPAPVPVSTICPVCFLDLGKHWRLQRHLQTKHRPSIVVRKTIICAECGKIFLTPRGFRIHKHTGIYRPRGPDRLKCTICEFSTSSIKRLNTHTRNNHQNTFLCATCGKEFRTQSHLKLHSRQHDPGRKAAIAARKRARAQVICPHPGCNKTFNPSGLWVHQACHSETRNFVCEHCGNAYKLATTLKLHIDGVHLRRNRKTNHRLFQNPGYVEGVRPYLCPLEGCGKAYTSMAILARHKRRHQDLLRFSCHKCPNAAFPTLVGLKTHMFRIHAVNWRNGRWVEAKISH